MPNLRKFLRLLFIYLIGKPIAYPVRRRLYRFDDATHDPQRVQETVLRGLLAYHAGTDFGRRHGFDRIQTVADFRRQLPIAGYDYFEPWIARVRRGETGALLADRKIHMFALTSGTTATRKFIPVTDRYLADYKRGWNIWGLKVLRDHRDTRLRPIVQLSGDYEEFHTEAGIPCGAVTGLTAAMQKRIIRWLYCVPGCVGKIKDTTAKYYVALRLSLPRQVAMVVSANPSTLLNLARLGDKEKEALIRDLADGTLSDRVDVPAAIRTALRGRLRKHPKRARELEDIVRRTGTLYPKDYWPRECLLGNWTGGSMGAYLRQYPRYYGNHPVRDVGLIASEGRMTIPFDDSTPAGILDITTHYFEFIPEAEVNSPQPTVLGAARTPGGWPLLHPAHDGVWPLPLSHPRRGARGRLPQPDAADRVLEQGGLYLERDGGEGIGVPGHPGHGRRASGAGPDPEHLQPGAMLGRRAALLRAFRRARRPVRLDRGHPVGAAAG